VEEVRHMFCVWFPFKHPMDHSFARATLDHRHPAHDHVSCIYLKPKGEPWIKAAGIPTGTHEFRARAWGAANGKARELGWVV